MGWQNLCLETHCQPSWELPELAMAQHLIILYEPSKTTTMEFKAEGSFIQSVWNPIDQVRQCLAIVPANLPFQSCWDQEIVSTTLYLDANFVSQLIPDELNPDHIEIGVETKRADPLMAQLVQALKAEMIAKNSENDFYIHSLETALAAHLIRNYSTRASTIPDCEQGLSRRQLHRSIEYIQAHLDQNLSLTAIAEELGLSSYYFCRLFKQSMGISPYQYLLQQRIEQAKQLLGRSTLKVTQVALACGFANSSHLAKHFRQQTGVSPTQFRHIAQDPVQNRKIRCD